MHHQQLDQGFLDLSQRSLNIHGWPWSRGRGLSPLPGGSFRQQEALSTAAMSERRDGRRCF
jgi:hypothetical protein